MFVRSPSPLDDARIEAPKLRRIEMKILLAVDGSNYTKRMLSYVAEHDELLGPGHEYTALAVVSPIPAHAAKFLDRATLDEYYRDQAEEILRTVQQFAEQQSWTVHVRHAVGHAAEVIAALAESAKHDLVVMGTHGHSSLGNVILGSVVTGVLARCKTPVLLIR